MNAIQNTSPRYLAVVAVPCPAHPLAADTDAAASVWKPLGIYPDVDAAREAVAAFCAANEYDARAIMQERPQGEDAFYDRLAALLAAE